MMRGLGVRFCNLCLCFPSVQNRQARKFTHSLPTGVELFEMLQLPVENIDFSSYNQFRDEHEDLAEKYRKESARRTNIYGNVLILVPIFFFCCLDMLSDTLYEEFKGDFQALAGKYAVDLKRDMNVDVSFRQNFELPLPKRPGYPCCCLCFCPTDFFYSRCGDPIKASAFIFKSSYPGRSSSESRVALV